MSIELPIGTVTVPMGTVGLYCTTVKTHGRVTILSSFGGLGWIITSKFEIEIN